MKNSFCSLILVVLISLTFNSQCLAQQPSATPIETQPNAVSEITGDLNRGQPMEDLSWAWNSSVACFLITFTKLFPTCLYVFEYSDVLHDSITMLCFDLFPQDFSCLQLYMKSQRYCLACWQRCILLVF